MIKKETLLTLRDRDGNELEAHIADYFDYKGATLSIVCPDSKATQEQGQPVLCVRLQKGVVEKDGRRFENEPDQAKWLFVFTAELVADCLRKTRPNLAPEFLAIESAKPPEPKSPKVRKASKSTVEDQPTLF